jgi:hypothetical protein
MHILLPAVTSTGHATYSADDRTTTEEQQTFCHNVVVAVIEIVQNRIENGGDAFTHNTC